MHHTTIFDSRQFRIEIGNFRIARNYTLTKKLTATNALEVLLAVVGQGGWKAEVSRPASRTTRRRRREEDDREFSRS
jgi:hypothetical protein